MHLSIRDSYLDLSSTKIMGILNLTPDSFYDGGKHNTISSAIKFVNHMVDAGASIIDIGGESTRPGSKEISTQEELERIMPVVELIVKNFDVWISVNTSKAQVMRESAKVGAHIINDIYALSKPGTMQVIAETGLIVCLMHMQGSPCTMQNNPYYDNIINEIDMYFSLKISQCKEWSIKKNQLILDPGFGFGKNLQHNYHLLAHLSHFHRFRLPLLVGMSRKSMISKLLNIHLTNALIGSISCAIIAAIKGAQIIRVHDVQETMEAIRIVEAVQHIKEIEA